MDAGCAQFRADSHTEIHGEAGGLRNEMTGLRNEMQRQFYWLMGAVGALGALMVSGFLQLGLRLSGH